MPQLSCPRASEDEAETGFTLLELLIVIVILGILAGVTVFVLSGTTAQSAVAACNADARTVDVAVAAYDVQTGYNHSGTSPPAPTAALLVPTYLQSFPSSSQYTISISSTGAVLVAAPASAAAAAYDTNDTCGSAGSGTGSVSTTTTAPSAALFSQSFHDNTADGTVGAVSVIAGANAVCLTAAGNTIPSPLASCAASQGTPDAQGSGTLRLTPDSAGKVGAVFAATTVPTSGGLDATFDTYQYGPATPGADGLAFVLAAVDPANPAVPTAIGPTGGSLGYSAQPVDNNNTVALAGLADGYLGIGLDTYGNYSYGPLYEGSGCTDAANLAKAMPGQVVVRGPGNGTVGYCGLKTSAATATSQPFALRAATRKAVPVEVVLNPGSNAVTTASGLTVPAGDYEISATPVGGATFNLMGALPVVPAGLYPPSWVNASGIPAQLAFGWVASTGAFMDYHEISDVAVHSLSGH